jgi:hypothetical protein
LSDEVHRRKGKRVFGFHGPRKKTRDNELGVDEILDSLSRRAELGTELDPVETAKVEDSLASEYLGAGLPDSGLKAGKSRGFLGKYAFVLMLLGGVIVVGLYGALKALTDPGGIVRVTQSPTFVSVFTDPLRLGLVLLFCLVPALTVRRRRSRQNRLAYA